MITSKICFVRRWWKNLRKWNLKLQREASEEQYKKYLDKLSPMRRESELGEFVVKVLPGNHIHSNPIRRT